MNSDFWVGVCVIAVLIIVLVLDIVINNDLTKIKYLIEALKSNVTYDLYKELHE